MELLNSNTTITSAVARILEIPDYFIVNGHIYDKATLAPIPFEFCIDESITFATSNFYRTLQTHNHHGGAAVEFIHDTGKVRLIQDLYNPDIFYTICPYNTYGTILRKCKKTENGYEILNQAANSGYADDGNDPSYGSDYCIIDQTDKYLIYKCIVPTTGSGDVDNKKMHYFGKIDKKTFGFTSLASWGWYIETALSIEIVEKKDNNYYIMCRISNTYYFYKVNIDNNSCTHIGTITHTDGVVINSNVIRIGNFSYFIADKFLYNGSHEYCFMKLKTDTVNHTITHEVVDVDANGFLIDSSEAQNLAGLGSAGVFHSLYYLKEGYIACVVHSVPNIVYQPQQHKIIVFKVEDDKMQVRSVTKLNNCRGILNYDDNNTILIALTKEDVVFYQFESDKEEYIKTYAKGGNYKIVGIDTLNRVFLHSTTNAVEVCMPTTPSILVADFIQEKYFKDNNNLETEVYYYAKNFMNKYITTSVTLTLVGNAIFKENNNKSINVITSDKGKTNIPVIIKGEGRIEVIISQTT